MESNSRPGLIPSLTLIAMVLACRSEPGITDPYQAGAAAYEMGDWDAALAHYERGLELHPDDPQLLDLKGETLLELGRLQQALAALDRSLALDAGNPYAHAHRGQVLVALGRTSEARLAFGRAVDLAPEVEHFRTYLEKATDGE